MRTIGYKKIEQIEKLEIAIRQLEDALALFTQERFISSLTLAGAAEEVLARLLEIEGKASTTERSISLLKEFCDDLNLDPDIKNQPKRQFYQYWNKDRNAVKHHDNNDPEVLEINDCDAAYWMIRRALSNAKEIGAKVRGRDEFENWVARQIRS